MLNHSTSVEAKKLSPPLSDEFLDFIFMFDNLDCSEEIQV